MKLDAYAEGLNYVPMLVQQTTPTSSYTRLNSARSGLSNMSLTAMQRQAEFSCYNGNYEGDSSMFGRRARYARQQQNEQQQRTHVIETDAEEENHEIVKSTTNALESNNQIWPSLLKQCKHSVATTACVAQVLRFTEQLQQNRYYCKLCDVLQLVGMLLLWSLRLSWLMLLRFSNWSYGLWKSRSMLRYATRRLLWCMTLAKYDDIYLFALILCATPVLFITALIGFILSLYCALKEWLKCGSYFVRQHVL